MVRGERAAFDIQWTPRVGVFWAGIERPRIRTTLEKSPVLLGDVHGLRCRAEVSCTRMRQATDHSEQPPGFAGLGQMLDRAMALR